MSLKSKVIDGIKRAEQSGSPVVFAAVDMGENDEVVEILRSHIGSGHLHVFQAGTSSIADLQELLSAVKETDYLVIQYIGFLEGEDSVKISRLIKDRGSFRTVGIGDGNDTLSKSLYDAMPIRISLGKGASISLRDEEEYYGNSEETPRAKRTALRCHIEASLNAVWPEQANVGEGGFYLAYLEFFNGVCLKSNNAGVISQKSDVTIEGDFWDGELSYRYERVSTLRGDYDIELAGDLAFELTDEQALELSNINSSALKSVGLQWAVDGDGTKVNPVKLTFKRGSLTDCAFDESFDDFP